MSSELQSTWDLLQTSHKRLYISSSSHAIDDLMGGGIPIGSVTQVAGESGSGKTQLCHQLSLNVQIKCGSYTSEVVYLDIENTFQPKRLEEMTEQLKYLKDSKCNNISDIDFRRFLSGIYVFQCTKLVELLAVSQQLFNFVKQHAKIKLIIVDSIAHCLRHEDDLKAKIKFIHILAENFKLLAVQHDLAVVLVNQVTTKLCKSGNSHIVPALGKTWSHVPSIKLMLAKSGCNRIALLYQSASCPSGLAHFHINKGGICDHIVKTPLSYPGLSSCCSHKLDEELQSNNDKDDKSKLISLGEKSIFKTWLHCQSHLSNEVTNFDQKFSICSSEPLKLTGLENSEDTSCINNDSPVNDQKDCSVARTPSPILVLRSKKRKKN